MKRKSTVNELDLLLDPAVKVEADLCRFWPLPIWALAVAFSREDVRAWINAAGHLLSPYHVRQWDTAARKAGVKLTWRASVPGYKQAWFILPKARRVKPRLIRYKVQ